MIGSFHSKYSSIGNQNRKQIVFALFLISTFVGCFTFNPRNSQRSLIIVSATLEKDEPIVDELFQSHFHNVTLKSGEKEISYTKKSGHYYYFQNLTAGQYELGSLVHYLNRGIAGNPQINRDGLLTLEPPLTQEDRLKTLVNLEPGSVLFLGEIQVKAMIRTREPIQIQATYSKSPEAERRALNHLIRNYPRSGWAELAKDRLKALGTISLQ